MEQAKEAVQCTRYESFFLFNLLEKQTFKIFLLME